MSVEIVAATTAALRKTFLHLPFRLYRDDPIWVPPLLMSERKLLNLGAHPFHAHADIEFYLAMRDGRAVGRIAAIVNREHLRVHDDAVGFWGFFETERDPEVAGALLARAEAFLRDRGMKTSRGPTNFSLNETCGVLVDGFDTPPFILMPHNPTWYGELIEGAGYSKAQDLLAFHVTDDVVSGEALLPKGRKPPELLRKIRTRPLDPSRLREEIKTVNALFNDAWQDNWGFVPMTEAELEFMADELKQILDPRLTFVAELNGEPIAFGIGLPNVNPLFKAMGGRLFPFGWLRFLTGRKKIDTFRVCLLGVRKDYHRTGIGVLLCFKMVELALKYGMKAGEMSWILESNRAMVTPIARLGGRPYKKYRIFERSL